MGACDFRVLAAGKDLAEAFRNAQAEAVYEHGHDSYNGTISTVDLKGLDYEAPRYGTKAFYEHVNKSFDGRIEKWTCLAVEVKGKALKEYRKRHGLERKRIRVFCFYGVAAC